MSSPSQPSAHVIPEEQLASLSRWGRVALVSRAAMRTILWFAPEPMRTRQAALGDLLAMDICSTLGMLAAAGARQLSAPVAQAAANAAMAALAAPGRVPLLPSDHAAMLAGMSVEWAGAPAPPDSLDAGSAENARAALGDLQTLLALGMQERGYEYPVPANFFSLPLWPAPGPDLRAELAQWEKVLASFNLLEFSQRFRNWSTGMGMDWGDAQRRAEAWVRMVVPGDLSMSVSAAPGAGASFTSAAIYPSVPPVFAAATPLTPPQPTASSPASPYSGSYPRQTPTVPPAAPPRRSAPPDSPAPSRRSAPPDSPPAWRAPLPATSGAARRPGKDPAPPRAAAPSRSPDSAAPTFRVPTPPRQTQGFADLEPYANALASFIDSLDPRAPFTLAIQGPNGSGRSVIGGMLRRRLAAKPSGHSNEPHLTLWFDANLPRSSPTLTTSLMRALALVLDRERPARQRHLHRLAWSLQPLGNTWKHVLVIVAAVLTILGVGAGFGLMVQGIPPDFLSARREMLDILDMAKLSDGLPEVAAFAGLLALAAMVEIFGFLSPTGKTLARYVKDKNAEDEDEARRQLAGLLRDAVPQGSRMVVFVEDLEQAGFVRAREFLESLKTKLKFPELVFVLLTDANALRQQSEEEHGLPTARPNQPDALNGVVDLQVDLPARPTTRPGQDSGTSRSSSGRTSVGHARGLASFWGPWSRDWRGDRRVEEVLQRTMYVDPPYLAPLVMVFWFFYWLPLAAYINVQEWVYPARDVRIFSNARKSLWHVLLTLAILGHGVLAFQTLDGLLTNLHYVVLYPDTRPFSIWVFLPLELATMGLILLFGAWLARSSRDREIAALKKAREVLRSRVKDLHAAGSVPLQAAVSLKGQAKLPDGEDLLVREAVVEEYLASEPDVLARLHAMVGLASGLQA